jgi:dihydroorotase
LQKALKKLRNKIICVHAEDKNCINTKIYKKEKPETHSLVRNGHCETVGISNILKLDLGSNHIHFCHVSTSIGLGLVNRSDKNVSCEVTPHHLLLDIGAYGTWGSFAKVNPPLRTFDNRRQLWSLLNYVDMLATDHAPHTLEEKEQEISRAMPGFPGVETLLPLMINQVNEKNLYWQDVVRLTSHGPSRVFGLKNKGEIVAGKDADIVVIDNGIRQTINAEDLHSKSPWTPYEGEEIQGAIDKVFLRGQLVIDSGRFVGSPGMGQEIS